MNLSKKRRMAAEILGIGENRLWIDPNKMDKVKEAITKEDIHALIKQGIIKKKKIKGTSRVRAKKLQEARKKGRRRGMGSRKGKATARKPRKEAWMEKIRAQRKFLRKLKEKKIISVRKYRELYKKAKSGIFRNVAHLKLFIKKEE